MKEVAKYFLDLSKVTFTLLVISPFIGKESFNLFLFICGFIATIILALVGYKFLKEEK
ncbi:MAG: DUF6722 family protein [bacterium]